MGNLTLALVKMSNSPGSAIRKITGIVIDTASSVTFDLEGMCL